MIKIIFLVLIISSSLFSRSIEVVPANIDFKNRMEIDIVEELYMMFHNGVSSYNSIQDDPSKLISVKESFLPISKYKKKISHYYKKNKMTYKEKYMLDNDLNFLLEYRVRHSDVLALSKCKYTCKVDIQVYLFRRGSYYIKKNMTMYYDSSIYSLSDESYEEIDEFMRNNLD
jgi:hypothetical protein